MTAIRRLVFQRRQLDEILQKSLLHLWRNLVELIEIDDHKLCHRLINLTLFRQNQIVTISPLQFRRLLYPAENLNELEIAYAITVHKSQGSEFPAVILPVAQVPPRLCYRNLFYTGVTRARRLCVVAGRRDVVNSMMSNIRQNLRYSGLCALLQAGQPPQQLGTEGESP